MAHNDAPPTEEAKRQRRPETWDLEISKVRLTYRSNGGNFAAAAVMNLLKARSHVLARARALWRGRSARKTQPAERIQVTACGMRVIAGRSAP